MLRRSVSQRKYLLLAIVSAVLVIFGIATRENFQWRSTEVAQKFNTTAGAHPQRFIPSTGAFEQATKEQESYANLPWYFEHGKRMPLETRRNPQTGRRLGLLMPEEAPWSDRITDQLMFVPPGYKKYREGDPLKTILLYTGIAGYGPWNGKLKVGRVTSKCPVDSCELTIDRDRATNADLVVYYDKYIPTGVARPARQLFMIYFLESPYLEPRMRMPYNVFNWTATYRTDSDVVAPYNKWEYYDSRVKTMEQDRNYATNKTKMVAWFVSNCNARNGRLEYGHELQKYIHVDIYGKCGTLQCTESGPCLEMIGRDYKFYLAFENANCKDYITEKLFVNSLKHNMLPIVMGARPVEYAASAPIWSYIHVDDFASAKELAEFLHLLDQNDELYNSYFQWKGTGEFINTYFWCRVCAMLHDEEIMVRRKWYEDLNDWWGGRGICS